MSDSPYRWIDREGESFYHRRYACVATVKRVDGGVEVILQNQRGREVRAMEPSIRLAKRHVERWFEAEGRRPIGRRKG
jgi:hypothetical protein